MKAKDAFQIFNIRTGEYIASRATRKLARRYADKLDLQYGAINYAVKQNYDDKPETV